MTGFGSVVVFTMIWTVVFLMALPFGVRKPDVVKPGHDPGAPENPRILIKMLITTLIATGLTALFWYSIENGWIDLRPEEFR